jgi:hypothetical protein
MRQPPDGPPATAPSLWTAVGPQSAPPPPLPPSPPPPPPGFQNTFDMVQSLKKAGLGSLELFCMGLKATGCYLARTLSYNGAEFQMEKIHLDPGFKVMYERAAKFWQLLWVVTKIVLTPGQRRSSTLIKLFW